MAIRDNDEERRSYYRAWVHARRDAFFKNRKCFICGSTERLELDHIDPALKISHNIWTWSLQRRTAEMVKCQVLCNECHKIKTGIQLSTDPKHGTNRMYNDGCRCKECRAFKKAKNAKRTPV